MKAERLIIDTNVLISALLSPLGTPRRLLNTLAAENATLLFSDATFAELVSRLARPKFDRYRTHEQMEVFLDWLTELGEWISPNLEAEVCRDSDDDKFLSLALSGEAVCLITGDDDLLALHPFEGISILSPAEFLNT
jgi:uncharacterized protein